MIPHTPDSSSPHLSRRAEQARREVGRTAVSRPVALALVLLAAVAIGAPPAVQTVLDLAAGRGPLPAAGTLLTALGDAGGGVFLFNRRLLEGIEATEERLEDESWLRARLLPPTQRLLTGALGLGNEQVVAGAEDWWYLDADFAHVVGRGFLDPAGMARRRRDEGVAADPVPAITAFATDLARREIELLVMPVPSKATVVPGPLSGGGVAAPVHNPSFGALVGRLTAAGVRIYDPTADLLAAAAAGTAPFLRTDTHWSPAGLDRVAIALSERVAALGVDGRFGETRRRRAAVTGRGDLATMLALPAAMAAGSETVEVDAVLRAGGDPWQPREDAEVLILGDSFTNVYSQAGLGWGAGAGLAEQLSHHLGAAVDRIARNAGGSWESRAELAAQLETGRDRLAAKRVVIYQFAARELSDGDWRVLPLPKP